MMEKGGVQPTETRGESSQTPLPTNTTSRITNRYEDKTNDNNTKTERTTGRDVPTDKLIIKK
jgi:hypothetical protein